MRQIILLLVNTILLLQAAAQTKDSILAEITKLQFTATEVGTPDGEPVSQKIGAKGGTIISSDQKVELIIPEGALRSNNTISIQPISNFAQDGVGKAFRLEPIGIEFLQPVQLVFHYSEKEMEEGSPQLMGIAFQDEKGVWYGLRDFKLDTVAKTITGNITHFSDWSERWLVSLVPEKRRVRVSNEIVLFLSANQMEKAGKPGVNARMNPFQSEFDTKKNWTVNGIPDGNSEVGQVHAIAGAPPTVISRIYKAPAQVPNQNPVEIKVELSDIKPSGEDSMLYPYQANITRKCRVLIYDDAYEVKMIVTMKGGDKKAWGGETTYYDEGSFVVSLDTKTPTIRDIRNNLETMTDNCKKIILNPGTNTGMIHITGVKGIILHPAQLPGRPYRVVEIAFIQRNSEFTRVKYTCPPPRGYTAGGVSGVQVMPPIPALPLYLKFMAKDEEQIIATQGSPGSELYYKIWVRKLKEDKAN